MQVTKLANLEILGDGSQVIITLHDKHVFEEVDITNIMEIYRLLMSDARKLFGLHAFGRNFEIIPNYDEVVHRIIKLCTEHPLMM